MTDQRTHPYPPTDPPSGSSADDEPDRVVSDPVPVPPPSDQDVPPPSGRDGSVTDRAPDEEDADNPPAEDVTDRVPDEALADRGTFDDPVLADQRTDPDDITAVSPPAESDEPTTADEPATSDELAAPGEPTASQEPAASDESAGSDGATPEFHEPAPQPTAFGAATVGGAAAAAALAGPSREATDADRTEAAERRGFTDDAAHSTEAADRRGFTDDAADRTETADRPAPADDEPYRAGAAETPVEDEPVAARLDAPAAAEADLLAGDALAEPVPVGDVPAEPVTALWGDETAQSFRDRWRDVQLRFVDDPQGAAQEARTLVADAVDSLTATLASQRDELSGWSGEEGNDTERLRVVVRQYRDFLDRLLGL